MVAIFWIVRKSRSGGLEDFDGEKTRNGFVSQKRAVAHLAAGSLVVGAQADPGHDGNVLCSI
jgi:hypothetical protein